jgi:SAM-dependent methyltransferase
MRKDYTIDTLTADGDEISFVEEYWSQVWKQEGGPTGAVGKVPRHQEFRIMRPYLGELPAGARLLDGGCGLGDWTLYFDRNGFSTLGLDISRETVAQLQARFPEAEFAVGDIRAIDFPDASFDGYFSWGTFEHFEEGLGRCVDEAYRILKPGGYLFITVPFDNLRHMLRAAFGGTRGKPAKHDHLRFYQWRLTRRELRDELSQRGFEVLDTRPIHNRQGVLRSLHHTFGLPYEWLLTKGLSVLLSPILPRTVFAHMIMAVARKPRTDLAEEGADER